MQFLLVGWFEVSREGRGGAETDGHNLAAPLVLVRSLIALLKQFQVLYMNLVSSSKPCVLQRICPKSQDIYVFNLKVRMH